MLIPILYLRLVQYPQSHPISLSETLKTPYPLLYILFLSCGIKNRATVSPLIS